MTPPSNGSLAKPIGQFIDRRLPTLVLGMICTGPQLELLSQALETTHPDAEEPYVLARWPGAHKKSLCGGIDFAIQIARLSQGPLTGQGGN